MEPNPQVITALQALTKTPRMEDQFPKMIPKHCETCDTIKGTKKQVADIEAEPRAQTPNPFETDRGRFWLSMTNRTYLKARLLHSEIQVRSWRHQGVSDALDNLLGGLDLDRDDSQGQRFVIPFLLLRLGRDQRCYDFCKLWKKSFMSKSPSDAREFSVPFLDIHGDNLAETVDLWAKSKFTPLASLSALYLIKLRLRQGLQAVQACMAANPGISSQDVLAKVRGKYCRDILEKKPALITDNDTVGTTIEVLDSQLSCLFLAINTSNSDYWKLMVKPTDDAASRVPGAYILGSLEEAKYVFMNSYSAWAETPEAIRASEIQIVL